MDTQFDIKSFETITVEIQNNVGKVSNELVASATKNAKVKYGLEWRRVKRNAYEIIYKQRSGH